MLCCLLLLAVVSMVTGFASDYDPAYGKVEAKKLLGGACRVDILTGEHQVKSRRLGTLTQVNSEYAINIGIKPKDRTDKPLLDASIQIGLYGKAHGEQQMKGATITVVGHHGRYRVKICGTMVGGGCYTATDTYPALQWIDILLTQFEFDGVLVHQAYINGDLIKDVMNRMAQDLTNVHIVTVLIPKNTIAAYEKNFAVGACNSKFIPFIPYRKQDSYVLGKRGVDKCPVGSTPVTSLEECSRASSSLGLTYNPSKNNVVGAPSAVCNYCGGCNPKVTRVSSNHAGRAKWICKQLPKVATKGGNAGGAVCVFPFKYKTKTYTSCTNIDHNQPWCATTTNYNTGKKWGNCQ